MKQTIADPSYLLNNFTDDMTTFYTYDRQILKNRFFSVKKAFWKNRQALLKSV